ncbi:MAG: TIGR03808 family TAT-translocated repetitive protein, partial [Hyphomicrobiales bacterium]
MTSSFSRRAFLSKVALCGASLTSSPALALPILSANPRSFSAIPYESYMIHAQAGGVVPGSREDQSANFQKLLNQSAEQDVPIFLPGGVYKVGGLVFPRRTRIIGVPGSTRLTFNGRNFLARAERADLIHVHGIIFDGLSLPLSENGQGLLTLNTVRDLRVSACDFVGSGLHGLDMTGAGGTVSGCYFHSIRDTAIFSKQSTGMTITDNSISECGNGGILVHRFTLGDDGSVVSNNRIENIKSTNGGTGQWGNGINIYQAHNVMVS